MSAAEFPLHSMYDLSRLSAAGYETSVEASAEDLGRIAEWAGVDAVTGLKVHVRVRPLSQTRFELEADLEADIVQACVVTLEPVETHIARGLSRELHLVPGAQRFADKGGLVSVAEAEEEGPEEIDSPRYDLLALALEDFVLAIDRYPRAPGVAFDSEAIAPEKRDNPFAVLERLKRPH